MVHVTQGTLNVDPHDLIEPAMSALGRQDVTLVVTTGMADAPSCRSRCRRTRGSPASLPYGELLPHVDVMITNGGWGGVLAGLAHGIPLVVAGGDLDKPEIAARVAWAGAGVNLRTGTPSARPVLEGWRRVATHAVVPGERRGASPRASPATTDRPRWSRTRWSCWRARTGTGRNDEKP